MSLWHGYRYRMKTHVREAFVNLFALVKGTVVGSGRGLWEYSLDWKKSLCSQPAPSMHAQNDIFHQMCRLKTLRGMAFIAFLTPLLDYALPQLTHAVFQRLYPYANPIYTRGGYPMPPPKRQEHAVKAPKKKKPKP